MTKKPVRSALQTIPYGLFVIGSHYEGGVATIVANWTTQVSFEPLLMAIAIEDKSKMQLYISKSKIFSINVLASGSKEIAKAFIKAADRVGNTINGREFTVSKHGTPFLKDAIACIECKVIDAHSTGDHILFIGEVVESLVNVEGNALTLKETGWHYERQRRRG
jgi:flavin reductase (DIM6/NTAB) family NADH-FMN oxidoreductase RutF